MLIKIDLWKLPMPLEEKEKRIENLENDLKEARIDKEDFKTAYNNYFLQVQTLINKNVLGSPTEKKEDTFNYMVQEANVEPKKEDKPPAQKTDRPTQKAGKPLLEKTCKKCGKNSSQKTNERKPALIPAEWLTQGKKRIKINQRHCFFLKNHRRS